jgi:NAD(P)H-hydrate epimerase
VQNLPLTLYRANHVRDMEQSAIRDHGFTGFDLMHRAGEAVFNCLMAKWPLTKTLVIVCGSGNNAGDGYIIATLAHAAGLQVTVHTLLDPEDLEGDAWTAYRAYLATDGGLLFFQANRQLIADVVVDAILGTGMDRPVAGLYKAAIEAINASPAHIIAVDVPSGMSADSGNVMAAAVKADCTMTFIGLKQGLFTGQAAEHCGEIHYDSLGVPQSVFDKFPTHIYRVVSQTWPKRARCSHKGNNGHVLVIGGDSGFSGAARLASEAAVRVGAGLVSVATRAMHAALLSVNRPELMCHGVETQAQLERLMENKTVLVLGPGLGQEEWGQYMFEVAINSGKPMVIDADGLNLLANMTGKPANRGTWILTPHPGEAGRLLTCTTSDVQHYRFASVHSIQARYGGIAVLKGAGTLIASGDDLAVSTTGNPGMGTGGMGDVLSGVIAGLWAQGLPPKLAAQQGVYIHGLAADLAVSEGGERGLLASHLMPYLRQLIND